MFPLTSGEVTAMNLAAAQGRRANAVSILMADRVTHITYTAIADVRDIRGPQPQGLRADGTTHSSAGWGQLLATLKSGGVVSFEVIFAIANHGSLLDASLEQTLESFKMLSPDGHGLQFTALVELNFSGKVTAGSLRAEVTLSVSGRVVKI